MSTLYERLFPYTLSYAGLVKCGYPTYDIRTCAVKQNKTIWDCEHSCRCKKSVDVKAPFWYVCQKCQFHPLKISENKYKCCGGLPNSPGCEARNHHVCGTVCTTTDFIKTKPPATLQDIHRSSSNIIALDCEFVYTTVGLQVARVSLISNANRKGPIYDAYIKPSHKVLDFNTRFSGISDQTYTTHKSKSLGEVRDVLLSIINSETILIGHALHTDLKGLGLCHERVIDTSVLFIHENGLPFRYSLQYLANKYLSLVIHEDSHNSMEDAITCLKLINVYMLSHISQ